MFCKELTGHFFCNIFKTLSKHAVYPVYTVQQTEKNMFLDLLPVDVLEMFWECFANVALVYRPLIAFFMISSIAN